MIDYVQKRRKRKAINLYIKYGLKTAPVIHELGYPNRKMLRIWYKKIIGCNCLLLEE